MIRLAVRYARYALSALATICSRSFYYSEEVKPTSLKARRLGNSPLLRPIRSSGKRLLTSPFHGLKTLRRARKNVLIPLVVAIAGSLLVIGCGTTPTGTSPRPTGTSSRATGTITEFRTPTSSSGPSAITAGPDGNLWFTEDLVNQIGRITPGGSITEFRIPTPQLSFYAITAGPDGNLWFTENNSYNAQIWRITPGGRITEFPIPSSKKSGPDGITAGPDGNLWFTENSSNQVGRITPGGRITEFRTPTSGSSPLGITAGPDGNLWFAEGAGNGQIGRITPGK